MQKRGRPKKRKIIHQNPTIDHFSPHGRPGKPDEIIVALEEYEAIRLHDHSGMNQKDAAKMMHISQQSFSGIVRDARKKISDALINAKILKIEGGHFHNKRTLDITNKLKRKKPNPELSKGAI